VEVVAVPRISLPEQVNERQLLRFTRWLAEKREEKGWTQAEMAEFLGFSVAYYNALENGKKNLSAKNLVKLAEKCDGLPFATYLLGEHTVIRYKSLRRSSSKQADQAFRQDKFLLQKEEEQAEWMNEMTALSSVLGSNRSVYGVHVTSNLAWFGYIGGRHMALIQPIISTEDLRDRQLMYVMDRHQEEKNRFMFIDLSNPLQSQLITPEAVVVRDLKLPLQAEELKKWDMTLEQVNTVYELNNSQVVIARVFGIVDLLIEKPRVHQYPFQYSLWPENQMMVMSAAWTAHQKQKYEQEQKKADRLLEKDPSDPYDDLKVFNGGSLFPPD
jgi:transcriptional regulator with XRE-family HTH domain